MIETRPLEATDRARWEQLFRAYIGFYERELSQTAYDRAWREITSGARLHGLGAWLDGELVGAGAATPSSRGMLLWGGSVREDARGRGCYRALVRARWDEAVRRGTPALAVGAGPMSRPILERLGFVQVLEFRRLESVLSDA